MGRGRASRNNHGRARLEFVDVATGQPVVPAPSVRAEGDGSAPTGRVVAELEGVEVPIEPDDLTGAGGGPHPREQVFAYDTESPADYEGQARALAAEKDRVPRPVRKPRALRDTFQSAREAAELFYQENEGYFAHVRDPTDGVRDWMDGIDVRVGGRHRKLGHTPTGQRILSQPPAAMLEQALAYVFGKAEGRRWESVDWDQIQALQESLEPYWEPYAEDEFAAGAIYWYPTTGKPTIDQIEALPSEDQQRYQQWEAAQEVRGALDELRDEYKRTQACLAPESRRVVERRLGEWGRWAADPSRIPEYACEPDEETGGYTCDYPSIAGELRELRDACEGAYDPDWATPKARRPDLGFPDVSAGPEDPRVEPDPPAVVDDEIEAAQRDLLLRQLAADGKAYGPRLLAVVEARVLRGTLYQSEYRMCGKRSRRTGEPRCWCAAAYPEGGHGPYWYAYWRDGDQRRSKYIGKTFRVIG